jgi:hypothetical protein
MARTSEGPATDRKNDPVIDPSANVLDLVEAAVRRLDDLAERDRTHGKEMADLRADHAREMRVKEEERLDAIRKVDQETSQANATNAQITAQALAKTVVDTADAARAAMTLAASATAETLDNRLKPILEGMAVLQQRMFEQAGAGQQQSETKQETRSGINTWVIVLGAVAGVGGLFLALIMAVVTVLALTGNI